MTSRNNLNKSAHPPMYSDNELLLELADLEYPIYDKNETYVVSGPLGPEEKPGIRGRQFSYIVDAEKWVVETFGGYYERIRGAEPDRWAFRVKRGSHRDQRGTGQYLVNSDGGPKVKFRVVR